MNRPDCAAPPTSLYVHVPFCQTLCTYCAFNTYAGMGRLVEPYVAALLREMEIVGNDRRLTAHTLFLGGGTPSVLSPAQAAAIVTAARDRLGLRDDAEITLEANPVSADTARLAAYRAAGVNRLSLGVQSAHADELKLFGRRHTFEEAATAFDQARQAGYDNISLDLIYGAPHQTRESWQRTLDAVLAWQPDHISLYSLQLEPGTSLHKRVERGALPHPDDDLAADMYQDAQTRLARAGLQQYEVSNWARPGLECIHNRQYWLNLPYLGFGAGAHGCDAGLRYWNVDPLPEYIARIAEGAAGHFPLSPAAAGFEEIDEPLEMSETLILGLRLVREGVRGTDFARRFGRSVREVFGPALDGLVARGLIDVDGDTIRLARWAYLVSNQVFVELLPG